MPLPPDQPDPPQWRDAREVRRPPGGFRRIDSDRPVWIRVDGRWYPGNITCWYVYRGQWSAWLSYQADPEHSDVAPVWILATYDPAAIVDRTAHPVPPGAP